MHVICPYRHGGTVKLSKENKLMKSNAQSAFDNYLLWLKYSPNDYKGATEAASDFIDTIEDMNEFETLVRKAAGK